MYTILSLDGGGIRGLYTARLLQRLALAAPSFLDKVDLFAGTSTGGILALGLAAGFKPEELVALYLQNATRIFDGDVLTPIRELHRPEYGSRRSDGRAQGEVRGEEAWRSPSSTGDHLQLQIARAC
jgi:predicted acylesterase/phospholipase RssA